MSIRIALWMVALLPLIQTLNFAQTGAAQVEGAVSDNSGAVIASADVALEDTQTGVRFDSKTNGSGLYLFAAVQSGSTELP